MFRNQYDTDVTTWSPQGRLFQVEYAEEAVKQGSACVGIASKTHVVIAAIKRSPSELASYQQKVFRIDDHLGIALSGLTADGRTLCKYMRGECMSHSFVYESALQTERLVVDVADKHQKATQSYVRRPFGVGLLVAGHDRTGPHLYQTSPSGNYYEWQAYALGARSQSAKTYLEKNLENFAGLGRDALIREALAALRTCTEAEKDLDTLNTVVGIVGRGEKFTILEGDVVAPFLVDLPTRPAAAAEEEEEEAAAPAPAAPASSEAMAVEGGDAPASAMEIS